MIVDEMANTFGTQLQAGILPREVIYMIFDKISYVSPASYAIQADLTTLFGGSEFSIYLWELVALAMGGLVVTTIIQALIPGDRRQPRQSII